VSPAQPSPGDELPALHIESIGAEPMKVMALLLRDSNFIHFDVGTVRSLGMGERPVNQGPINLGYVTRMVAVWAGAESAIERLKVRFLANVFAGDHVVASGRVISVDTGDDAATVATCEVWLDLADGRRVVEGTATVRLTGRSRCAAATTP